MSAALHPRADATPTERTLWSASYKAGWLEGAIKVAMIHLDGNNPELARRSLNDALAQFSQEQAA